ncbi:MAG: hypothetical protein ACR2RV_16960 [Verrucomicrobiales bacterium]
MKILPTVSAALLLFLFPALAADEPAKASKKAAETEAKKSMAKCPVCEKESNPDCSLEYEEETYTFDSEECRDKWQK